MKRIQLATTQNQKHQVKTLCNYRSWTCSLESLKLKIPSKTEKNQLLWQCQQVKLIQKQWWLLFNNSDLMLIKQKKVILIISRETMQTLCKTNKTSWISSILMTGNREKSMILRIQFKWCKKQLHLCKMLQKQIQIKVTP